MSQILHFWGDVLSDVVLSVVITCKLQLPP